MGFANYIKPLLEQNSQSTDEEWYLKATTDALNLYMQELEETLSVPTFALKGTTTTPAGVTTAISGPLGYFGCLGRRFTVDEVKSAMWCGNATLCFVNLFKLFGRKFAENFVTVQAKPTVNILTSTVKIPQASFKPCALGLLGEATAIGSKMTPDKFAELEDKYLALSLSTIPPQEVLCTGTGLIPPGTFAGSCTVNLSFLGV